MWKPILTACIAFLASSCARASDLEPAEPDVIRWGSSFGMCAGYCREELEVTRDRARLTTMGWDVQRHPPRVEERALTSAEWSTLRSRVQDGVILALDSVYGCPDCADGGAEWVEVQIGDRRQRIVFEFGRGPTELQPVLAVLRPLRGRFPPR